MIALNFFTLYKFKIIILKSHILYYSIVIAATGQLSIASLADSNISSAISSSIGTDIDSSSMLNTSGHIPTHASHPIQASLSTKALIFYSHFLYVFI